MGANHFLNYSCHIQPVADMIEDVFTHCQALLIKYFEKEYILNLTFRKGTENFYFDLAQLDFFFLNQNSGFKNYIDSKLSCII